MARDMFGQEIQRGHWVAYPGRYSSSLWLTIALVVDVDGKKITTKSVAKEYGSKWEAREKTGTTGCTDRCVIIPRAGIPVKVRELVEPAADLDCEPDPGYVAFLRRAGGL